MAGVWLVCGFVLAAWPAAAQDFAIDAHLIDRCLAIQDDPMVCVGRQADACIQRNGGGADMIIGVCQENETAVWDATLNRTYAELLRLVQAEQEMDVGYAPNQLTDAVRQMQRSWIKYRDDTCGVALAREMPFGSAAGPAASGCMMRETARQFFQLNYIAGQYR
ncbi:lysozyme inhibitor LprI family protein [Octadecabacter sp. R77987]|uniref:lysozyme inhibitor LprI family protein n=1 Tax=Octadecabacter sp. R77987 TaxID=3093874 RepID=UPI00366B382D